MCGICGYASESKTIDTSLFYEALSTIEHRGPDDEGLVGEGPGGPVALAARGTVLGAEGLSHIDSLGASRVLLGHRRLAILDPTPAGHQPFCDANGRYYLTYNGEIFNFIELRRELQSLGHAFTTSCDTEVVLASLMEWGVGAFQRFNGMWALALWDSVENTILLSRDRFGIKPLFYSVQGQTLVFASEVQAIRTIVGLGELDTVSATRYLESCLLNDTSATMWSDTSELEPGHWAVWSNGKLAVERYWHFEPSEQHWSDGDALARFAELFESSLALRMRSDVPVGTLLSGGLDSSLIVYTLAELGLLGDTFDSFSAVFEEEEYSERRYVESIADRLPLRTHWVTPDPETVENEIDTILMHMGQPFRSLAVYSQHLLYRAVRSESDVIVLLNGQGADELFGGYDRHYYVLFGELFGRGRWLQMLREMRAYSRGRERPSGRVLRLSLGHMRRALRQPNYFNRTLWGEVNASALREYLAYEDRNSMAASVESRVPFLDYRMVEFAFSLESSHKIRGFENKWVERECGRRVLPASITERTDKMGFVSPQELWQREGLLPAILGSRDSLSSWTNDGFLAGRTDLVERFDKYIAGDSNDWSFAWRVYCLDRWLRLTGFS